MQEAVDRVLEANQTAVDDYRVGSQKVLGFLVGQVMKELKGKADPKAVNQALLAQLKG